MFEHEHFEVYPFNSIPLNEDTYLMDECYIHKYEEAMLKTFSGGDIADAISVGYISRISVRNINELTVDLSWYPNISDRFHEVSVSLPKEQFVTCVSSWQYGEKPRIFVKSAWHEHLYLKLYSVFCMIDAIDVKDALKNGVLTREKLVALRDKIDEISKQYPNVSFISFADTILLKSNWSVGHFKSDVSYTYHPEIFINVVKDIRNVYQEMLGLNVYAIMTQGNNEYYEDSPLHISCSGNHVCLNSLGIPFAQLMWIDSSARTAIKDEIHDKYELYLDTHFLHSLNTNLNFKDTLEKYPYHNKMTGKEGYYYCTKWNDLLENIERQPSRD